MPQEFQVLQCFRCNTFQVHQVKKLNKWVCKLCGEKQSVIKVYARGTGVDCRHHVQKLNQLRSEKEIADDNNAFIKSSFCVEATEDGIRDEQCIDVERSSKWLKFQSTVTNDEPTSLAEHDEDFTTYEKNCGFNQKGKKRKRMSEQPFSKKNIYLQKNEKSHGNTHSCENSWDGHIANSLDVKNTVIPYSQSSNCADHTPSHEMPSGIGSNLLSNSNRDTHYSCAQNSSSKWDRFGEDDNHSHSKNCDDSFQQETSYSSSKWGKYVQFPNSGSVNALQDYNEEEKEGTDWQALYHTDENDRELKNSSATSSFCSENGSENEIKRLSAKLHRRKETSNQNYSATNPSTRSILGLPNCGTDRIERTSSIF